MEKWWRKRSGREEGSGGGGRRGDDERNSEQRRSGGEETEKRRLGNRMKMVTGINGKNAQTETKVGKSCGSVMKKAKKER